MALLSLVPQAHTRRRLSQTRTAQIRDANPFTVITANKSISSKTVLDNFQWLGQLENTGSCGCLIRCPTRCSCATSSRPSPRPSRRGYDCRLSHGDFQSGWGSARRGCHPARTPPLKRSNPWREPPLLSLLLINPLAVIQITQPPTLGDHRRWVVTNIRPSPRRIGLLQQWFPVFDSDRAMHAMLRVPYGSC